MREAERLEMPCCYPPPPSAGDASGVMGEASSFKGERADRSRYCRCVVRLREQQMATVLDRGALQETYMAHR